MESFKIIKIKENSREAAENIVVEGVSFMLDRVLIILAKENNLKVWTLNSYIFF